VVRYGGGGVAAEGAVGSSGGRLEISDTSVEYGRQYGVWVTGGELSIRDSVISGTVKSNEGGNADGIGLYMSASGDVAPVISNTRFIGNEGPAGYLDLGSVALDASRISGNTAEGNGGNSLWLGATFTGTSVMVNAGVPYVNYISGLIVAPGVVLTIERGTVLKSRSNGVAVGGALYATGQAGEEVIFTSLYDDAYGGRSDPSAPDPASGQWSTLQARGSGRIVLDHTVVRYGGLDGEGAVGSRSGAVEISDSTIAYNRQYGVWVSDGQLSIRDSVISGTTTGVGSGTGLYLSGSGAVAPVISGTRFLNNEGYAGYLALGSVSLDASGISGNTAEGNVSNGLSLFAAFTGASVMVNAGIPYVIESPGLSVDPGAVLIIDKGTVVKSPSDGVTVDGALHATGQDGEEVVFTSFYDDDYGGDTDGGGGTPAGGDWAKLLANTGGQIVLDHTIARYGGANDGGVVGSSGGRLEISDTSVEYGRQYGVWVAGGELSIRDSVISGTTATGTGGDGLYRSGAVAEVSITNTHVLSNAGWGLRLDDAGDGALLEGNDIVGNGAGGVLLTRSSPRMYRNLITGNYTGVSCTGSSQPFIGGTWQNGNDIYSNTVGYGVENASEVSVTATYNWWGSPTGPKHDGNPDGLGELVTDWVDYAPYLGASTRPPTPVLAIAPTLYDFGRVDASSISQEYTFTVANTGSGAWTVGAAAITGAGEEIFKLVGGTCSTSLLAPIATCTRLVRFAPVAPGLVTATLTLPGSGPDGTTLTALLRGSGIVKVYLPLVVRDYAESVR
jgi:hypothetical protein